MRALLVLSIFLLAAGVQAAPEEPTDEWGDEWGEDEDPDAEDDAVDEWTDTDDDWGSDTGHELGTSIFGDAARRRRIAGSANEVDQRALELNEDDDPGSALAPIPGVYVRAEDGYGLRPNIGMRGASSDRSSKVTLMEDGVLFAPAPYAAPQAYYFPLMTRMTGIEIFKGPAAIRYGPNTVGGALNLRSRSIPVAPLAGAIDVAAGAYESTKAHAWFSGQAELGSGLIGGVLVEGVNIRSGGFKRLDRGGPTGFDRTDLMMKARVSTPEDEAVYQALELKLGWGGETSNETYLGLTDEDFRRDPNRRYAASQLGLMNWDRTQFQLSYILSLPVDVDVRVTAYRNDFSRSWRKLNRFRGGPELSLLLKNPDAGINGVFSSILRGQSDSEGSDQGLLIGTNARAYYGQGVQAVLSWSTELGALENTLEIGARIHADGIERQHTEEGYDMRSGVLVPDDTPLVNTVQNRGAAVAGSAYVHDEIEWGDLLVVPGARVELIRTDFENLQTGETLDDLQLAVMPGIGASYSIFDALHVLAGVHRGFSPVSPGQSPETRPEESINYEAGVRFGYENTRGELIGFFNSYANLTGECTFSTGCSDVLQGNQFNGGQVNVYGFEALAAQGVRVPGGLWLQADLSYTFTMSEFQTGFISDNPQFGTVTKGDELAYVPVHQGAAQLLLAGRTFDLATSMSWASAMRDSAGQGPILAGEGSDAYTLVDVVGSYKFTPDTKLYLKIDNVLNARYIASRRPFGARPGKPLSFMVGLKHAF